MKSIDQNCRRFFCHWDVRCRFCRAVIVRVLFQW